MTGVYIKNPLEVATKSPKIKQRIIKLILNPITTINAGKRLIRAFLEFVWTKKKVFNINNKRKKDFVDFLFELFSKKYKKNQIIIIQLPK